MEKKEDILKKNLADKCFFLGPTDPRVGSAIASNIWSIYHKV